MRIVFVLLFFILVNAEEGQSAIGPIKLYINDHELNSATQASALSFYGEMDIYFVDHASEVPIGSLKVPATDRRVTATVEYTF